MKGPLVLGSLRNSTPEPKSCRHCLPWDTAPRYLVRDRDQTYGAYFDSRVDGLGIEQVLTAPALPVAESIGRKDDRLHST